MKSIVLILLLSLGAIAANAQLKPGDKLGDSVKVVNRSKYLLTSAGSIDKVISVVYQGCNFDLKLKTDGAIKSVFTNDKKFISPEGIRVGDSFLSIKNQLADTLILNQPGWAKYAVLKSGWKVAFDFRQPVTNSAQVSFMFR